MSITKDIRVNFKKFYTKLQGKSQTTWRTSVLDCSAAQFAANDSCKHRSLMAATKQYGIGKKRQIQTRSNVTC